MFEDNFDMNILRITTNYDLYNEQYNIQQQLINYRQTKSGRF